MTIPASEISAVVLAFSNGYRFSFPKWHFQRDELNPRESVNTAVEDETTHGMALLPQSAAPTTCS